MSSEQSYCQTCGAALGFHAQLYDQFQWYGGYIGLMTGLYFPALVFRFLDLRYEETYALSFFGWVSIISFTIIGVLLGLAWRNRFRRLHAYPHKSSKPVGDPMETATVDYFG